MQKETGHPNCQAGETMSLPQSRPGRLYRVTYRYSWGRSQWKQLKKKIPPIGIAGIRINTHRMLAKHEPTVNGDINKILKNAS